MSTERRINGLKPRAKTDVSRLVRANRDNQTPALQAVPTATPDGPPATRSPHLPSDRVTEAQTPELTESALQAPRPVVQQTPKYLQLRRREARIHHDQEASLSALTRRLNDARRQPDGSTVGERITDNTLVRIAIDLLMTRAEELHGATEAELARSLGLTPRN